MLQCLIIIGVSGIEAIDNDSLRVDELLEKYHSISSHDYLKAQELIDSAYAISNDIGYSKGIYRCNYYLGEISSRERRYIVSDSFFLECLAYNQRLNDDVAIADVKVFIGWNAIQSSRLDSAEVIFLEAWDLIKDRNLSGRKGDILNNLGIVEDFKGDYDKASKLYLEALGYLQQSDNKTTLSNCYSNLSTVFYSMNEYEKALLYQKKAIAISEELNNRYSLTMNQVCMSSYYLKLNQYAKAREYAELSLTTAKELSYKKGEIFAKTALGDTYLALGDFKRANRIYADVMDTSHYTLQPRERIRVGMKMYEVQYRKKQFSKLELDEVATDTSYVKLDLDTLLSPQDKMESHWMQSKLAEQKGDVEKAYDELLKSNEYREEFVDIQKQKSVIEAETAFKTNEIIGEKSKLEIDSKAKNHYLIFSMLGLLVVVLLSVYLWRKMKSKEMQNIELDAKNRVLDARWKEVDHRYRNQMNMAVRLLEDTKRQIGDNEALNAFTEFENKMLAFAALSQLLSGNRLVKDVDLKQYLATITGSLVFNVPDHIADHISVEQQVSACVMDSKKALLVGLIYTELFTNSVKHAFDEMDNSLISVSTVSDSKNELVFDYQDNGKGLIDIESHSGEGMQLIQEMVSQIKGSFDILTPKQGFRFLLKIPRAA